MDAWVVRQPRAATVLLSNHALPRHSIETEQVHVQVTAAALPRNVYVERIDEDHANAKRRWLEMGKPESPNAREVEQMCVASQMVREPQPWKYGDGTIHLELALPPHAVAAITVEFAPEPAKGDALV